MDFRENDLELLMSDSRLISLSVFFPVHNEVDALGPLVDQALDILPAVAKRFEVIIVDDGSDDGTSELAKELAVKHSAVRLVRHPRNQGYGAALRSGIAAARLDYVFLTDADGQFDLKELPEFAAHLKDGDLVIGYRVNRQDNLARRLNGILWNMLVRVLFRIPVRDVDCAFKLLPRQPFQEMPLVASGAMISTELLARARTLGLRWVEVGVHHYPRRTGSPSGGSLRVIGRAFCELWALHRTIR